MPADAEHDSDRPPHRKSGRPFWTVETLRELVADRIFGDHAHVADARATLHALGFESWEELMRRAWGPL